MNRTTWYKGFGIVYNLESATYGAVIGGHLKQSKNINAVKRAIDNWTQA